MPPERPTNKGGVAPAVGVTGLAGVSAPFHVSKILKSINLSVQQPHSPPGGGGSFDS